jgi:hypothetical protein
MLGVLPGGEFLFHNDRCPCAFVPRAERTCLTID